MRPRLPGPSTPPLRGSAHYAGEPVAERDAGSPRRRSRGSGAPGDGLQQRLRLPADAGARVLLEALGGAAHLRRQLWRRRQKALEPAEDPPRVARLPQPERLVEDA